MTALFSLRLMRGLVHLQADVPCILASWSLCRLLFTELEASALSNPHATSLVSLPYRKILMETFSLFLQVYDDISVREPTIRAYFCSCVFVVLITNPVLFTVFCCTTAVTPII